MFSIKNSSKLLVAFIVLISVVAFLKADYYKPDFFPIGLTGLNYTGGNPPYSNVITVDPPWDWDRPSGEHSERHLIEELGVNCIGSEDALPSYLMDMKPTNPGVNNYLHKVCMPTFGDGNASNNIYLIPAGLYVDYLRVHGCARIYKYDTTDRWHVTTGDYATYPWRQEGRGIIIRIDTTIRQGKTIIDTVWRDTLISSDPKLAFFGNTSDSTDPNNLHKIYVRPSGGNPASSTLFRSWTGASGAIAFGPDEFDTFPSTWDNDMAWDTMMDRAIDSLGTHFQGATATEDSCIWGWNILTEGPAIYRKSGSYYAVPDPKKGVWSAVNRVLTGNGVHGGIRGIESSHMNNVNRMVVAKGGTWPLDIGGYNIFQDVPELDAFVSYAEQLCPSYWDYGDQKVFDRLVWGNNLLDPKDARDKMGWQNTAKYFQNYGKTGGRNHRRWIIGIGTAWYHMNPEATRAIYRRPCPPEFRCATWLALSRGAKGVMFIRWIAYVGAGGITNYPRVPVPCDTSGLTKDYSNVSEIGMRDHLGYPFGWEGCPSGYVEANHWLNAGGGSTVWHSGSLKIDRTYPYLRDELIPELKAVGSTIVKLDWVNAYSLASTCGKASPCPLGYVYSVTDSETPSDTYFDLGFFTEQSTGIDYLMVVNREGIADMTNRTITIKLYGWQGVSQIEVTDVAASTTRTVTRDVEGHFVLPSVFATFEPGQGKLFKITWNGGVPLPDLGLTGERRKGGYAQGFMRLLGDGGGGIPNPLLGWAFLKWTWISPQPADIDSMKLWTKRHTMGDWYGALIVEDGSAKPGVVKPPPIPNYMQHWAPMEDSCMYFVEAGNHESGNYWGEPFGTGTISNVVRLLVPPYDPGGCPELYSYFYRDTTLPAGFLFVEQNTILPHSRHVQAMAYDLLRLDALNTGPDHYYMNVLENSTSTSYIDLTRLWAVDHPEGTEVVTSANDSMYVYSEMQYPLSCVDDSSSDRLGEVLWEDTASFGGPDGSYITVGFDDPGWTHAGLLVTTGMRGYPQPPDKDFYSVPQDSGASGWDSLGVVYGRLNPYSWVVDVSESEDFTFRILNHGADTAWLDRIALVKLEGSGWSKQVATLDSAVKWDYNIIGGNFIARNSFQRLTAADGTSDTISPSDQLSLSFDKLDTTSLVRTFVLETRGWYSPEQAGGGAQSNRKAEIPFGLNIKQLQPFSNLSEIRYSVPYTTKVTIAVYDVSGRLVREVVDKEVTPGYHVLTWEGEDYAGRRVSAGLYFVRMTADEYKAIRKLIVLR